MLDVIILSHAKTGYHQMLTNSGIDTLLASEKAGMFNVIVIEGNKDVTYDNVKTVHLDEPFNYNKFMNYGAKMGQGKYIAFCNNDLEYKEGWATKILESMEANNLDSASPFCEIVHRKMSRLSPTGVTRIGYGIRMEFAGWCFVMRRTAWELIGGLDEDFPFWCADNATVEQLMAANLKHGLVTGSFVNHIGGGEHTLKTLDPAEREQKTFVLIKKFNQKYDRNVWGLGK